MLQIASPDAIVRCVANDEENRHLEDIYFIEQEHSSLAELINRIKPVSENLLLQVKYSCYYKFEEFSRLLLIVLHYYKMNLIN